MFVYFGCGAAASNLQKIDANWGGVVVFAEWDPASVVAIALVFGLAITGTQLLACVTPVSVGS